MCLCVCYIYFPYRKIHRIDGKKREKEKEKKSDVWERKIMTIKIHLNRKIERDREKTWDKRQTVRQTHKKKKNNNHVINEQINEYLSIQSIE